MLPGSLIFSHLISAKVKVLLCAQILGIIQRTSGIILPFQFVCRFPSSFLFQCAAVCLSGLQKKLPQKALSSNQTRLDARNLWKRLFRFFAQQLTLDLTNFSCSIYLRMHLCPIFVKGTLKIENAHSRVSPRFKNMSFFKIRFFPQERHDTFFDLFSSFCSTNQMQRVKVQA